jgi:peptide deformylase
MSLMQIVWYPDAPLQERAEPVDVFGPKLRRLAENMLETMYENDGVGLAGPQVGVSRRIFVMHDPQAEPRCLVNPEIVAADGSQIGEEGCLSLPDVYAPVDRAMRVQVRAFDPMGELLEFEADGLEARIIQHENDHLDGRMFIDRLDLLSREDKLEEWLQIRERLLPQTAARGR